MAKPAQPAGKQKKGLQQTAPSCNPQVGVSGLSRSITDALEQVMHSVFGGRVQRKLPHFALMC